MNLHPLIIHFYHYARVKLQTSIYVLYVSGPALSTRGNLAHARDCGAGSPRTVEHRYLPCLGCYATLMMMAKE